jgi:hypothetical protein
MNDTKQLVKNKPKPISMPYIYALLALLSEINKEKKCYKGGLMPPYLLVC